LAYPSIAFLTALHGQIGSGLLAHLKQQFKDALSNIEPQSDKSNAPEAHKQVRAALEADPKLVSYGIDPVLIGSYRRNVSIRRIKDVDVFGRMPDLPRDVTSRDILDHFFKVLNEAFGRDEGGHLRTKRQARSLQVAFPEFDMYVDAVPARPHAGGAVWEIPQKGEDNKWVQTNPEALTLLSSEMNTEHSEFYVPTVKLLRQTRRAQLGKKKPGGFFIEAASYQAFASGLVKGNDNAEYYATALRAVSDIIRNFVDFGIGVKDYSVLGAAIAVRATDEELLALKEQFAAAAASAESALDEKDEGKAALAFQKLLGKNGDDDLVFPMPPGYNEDGTKRASSISSGARTVPAGDKNFG
jgi:hypothetical protein